MEKIVKTLWYKYGFGFAYVREDEATGTYRGTCSNGNSTKATASLSQCISDLHDMGYAQDNVRG